MFCLKYVHIGILEYIPQSTIKRYFFSLVQIKKEVIYYIRDPTRQLLLDSIKVNPSVLCCAPEMYRRDLGLIIEACTDPGWILDFKICIPDKIGKVSSVFTQLCRQGKFTVLSYILQHNYNVLCEGFTIHYPCDDDDLNLYYEHEERLNTDDSDVMLDWMTLRGIIEPQNDIQDIIDPDDIESIYNESVHKYNTEYESLKNMSKNNMVKEESDDIPDYQIYEWDLVLEANLLSELSRPYFNRQRVYFRIY